MARKSLLSKVLPAAEPVEHGPSAGPLAAVEETETPPALLDAPGAANDTAAPSAAAETASPQAESSASPGGLEAGVAIAEALNETDAAEREAAQALEAEGVRSTPGPAAEPIRERRTKTPAQLAHAARRQRELGRRLLSRRTRGFASRIRQVRLNNYLLAAAFERFYPVIERGAYLVTRFGEMTLGEGAAEQILERLGEMTHEAIAERQKELDAVQAHIGEVSVSMGDRFITPEFTAPAYDAAVQVRTPQADRALEIFVLSDQLLTEFETLYWNQLRSVSERNDQALRAKRAVWPIFRFAARSTINLNRKMKTHAGELAPEDRDARTEARVSAPHANAEPKAQSDAGELEPSALAAEQ